MGHLKIRTSLIAVLVIFVTMILAGGMVGISALKDANRKATRLREIARQTILVNDGYKDTMRVRMGQVHAYSALKEYNDLKMRDSALAAAKPTSDRAESEMRDFQVASKFEGLDDDLKQEVLHASTHLESVLGRANEALRDGDTAAFVLIKDREISPSGAAYSASIEKFQRLANRLSEETLAEADVKYQRIVGIVVAGVVIAVILIVVTHFALRRIVSVPLAEAAAVLDRIAANDLTVCVPDAGNNEVGQLFAAMRRMQLNLERTVSDIRSGSETVYRASQEIAAGNLDLASRTEQQSASLEETAASMAELTSRVKQNADNALHASTLAAGAADLAKEGGDMVSRAVQTMTFINASSRKIAEITGMIDSIAFQTNILALNAAVESARAGEQGRGFAVVAAEVRTLAQRSAGAAREIKTLIGASIDDVRTGNELVSQAGQTMDEIVASIRRVATVVAEITTASDEQRMGIEEVGRAVSQMDQVTQQNAALVEQAAAAASALEHQAQAMNETMSVFCVRGA